MFAFYSVTKFCLWPSKRKVVQKIGMLGEILQIKAQKTKYLYTYINERELTYFHFLQFRVESSYYRLPVRYERKFLYKIFKVILVGTNTVKVMNEILVLMF